MSRPAIVIVQKFTYRDAPEEFSNKYHFTASAPSTDAAWLTLANNLIGHLTAVFPGTTSFVRAYGYTDGSVPSVWGHDYELAGSPSVGTFVPGTAQQAPGDVAGLISWPTAKRNSRGKVVYARKYFHDVFIASPTEPDGWLNSQATAAQVLASALESGAITQMGAICLPDGTAVGNGGPKGWLTTRTLKRRGKRPPT